MKKSTLPFWILSFLLLTNIIIGWRVYAEETKATGDDEIYQQIDTLMEVIQMVRKNYVDPEKVKPQELFKGAIQGVMDTLDPFSDYLEGDDKQTMQEETEGEFGGIGITVDWRERYIVVVAAIDGTPAQEAGLRAGDMILKVDGESVETLGFDKTIKKMRGEPGSTVELVYNRDSFDKPRKLTLTRAKIPIYSVTKAQMIPDTPYGYVRITQFMDKTAEELKKALTEKFSGDDIKGLVIDLRNNPGGLLRVAVDIVSYFLPNDKFILSVEGRENTTEFRSKSEYKFHDIPLVLLVDRGSASAAEIMSGSLQANKRAILIGEKTYGKGSVQNIIELSNGAELKLTIAHYFVQPKTVVGRKTIHKHGLLPDIPCKYTKQELKEQDLDIESFTKALKEDKGLTEAQRITRNKDFVERMERNDKVLKMAVTYLNSPEETLEANKQPQVPDNKEEKADKATKEE